MDGIIPTQKSASAPPAMGILILMVVPHRGAIIPRFSAICVVLGPVMILVNPLTSLLLMV